MISRQDLNSYRTPEDVARRFKLGDIELNTEDIEKLKEASVIDDALSQTSEHAVENKVITSALNNLATGLGNKVDKVTGKDLSTNDFTDGYKNEVDSTYSLMHWHDNKADLDTITTAKIQAWDSSSSLWYVLTQTGSSNYIELPSSSREFMIAVKGTLNAFDLGHFSRDFFTAQSANVKELGSSYSDQYDSWSCKVSVAFTQNSDIRITLDRVEEGGTVVTSSSVLYVYYK